jgi:uncharacterized protein DUF4416
MSKPQRPKPAKLVVGLFMNEKRLFDAIMGSLTQMFGGADIISAWFPFDYTAYYEPEMGAPLFRRMVAFKNLILQNDLPAIKLDTNDIELIFLKNSSRTVNIDPGYLTLERFVLATGKNFTHRIYLDRGIYADLTLIYQKGDFRELPWTYPDYRQNDIKNFLKHARNKYTLDLKSSSQHT